jgi:hypothetical protein
MTETRLPCGHVVYGCDACDQERIRLKEYEAHVRAWEYPGIEFAVRSGRCVHVAGLCGNQHIPTFDEWTQGHTMARPLTRSEAEAWLRENHEHRRCRVCAPDIQEPAWVKVERRWVLAESMPPAAA